MRQIRENAILHSRITAPFSSNTPVAVDAPDLQADKLRPKVSSGKTSHEKASDSGKGYSMPYRAAAGMYDKSSLHDLDAETLFGEETEQPIANSSKQSRLAPFHQESQDLIQDYDSASNAEVDMFNSDDIIEEEELRKLPVWFGDLSRDGFDQKYLALRDDLSQAAYFGNFRTLFQVLSDVEVAYAQSWANAPRLSKS